MANISFYGSHNGAYVVEDNGKIVLVLEIERYLRYKNLGLAQYKTPHPNHILYFAEEIPKFIMKHLGIDEFENCYYQNDELTMDGEIHKLHKYIPAKNYIPKLHHRSHAAGCFYQSNFQEALIFSFDGGGNDGMFNIYTADRSEGVKEVHKMINPLFNNPHLHYNLGFPYMVFAHYMEDIRLENLGDGNLTYPGKLMGLSSYGNVRHDLVPFFKQFYKNNTEGPNHHLFLAALQYHINLQNSRLGYPEMEFNLSNRLKGQVAYDIAATSQQAFEECFFEVADEFVAKYPNLPICLTGGCGLNIILNTKIVERYGREVFVGPNPSDCGIAAGMILDELKPQEPVDLTYSGLPLLDLDMLHSYIQSIDFPSHVYKVNHAQLAQHLMEGSIVGVARGRAEHGPRALGNRSILCNPSIADMKDVLNAKVKNREWYRPFAPVVRLEDVNKYFEWNGESRWMSFCPRVREEWKETLAAITHIDGTARVQTVTREQNEWLYDLLTEFESLTGIGVLLNTSFNVNGKPILSSVREAFDVFNNTRLDALVIEDTYITKG